MSTPFKFFFLLLLCASCSNSDYLATITVSETEGLDRELEYVNAKISMHRELSKNELLVLIDIESQACIPVLELKSIRKGVNFEYHMMFPLKISANKNRRFNLGIQEKTRSSPPVQLVLSEDKLSVENTYYKVNFSSKGNKRGGQITGIELKDFENQLLKRGHIAMHWAPNFSKSDSEDYFNLEDLPPNSDNSIEREFYQVIKKRSGITDSVPEIFVEGRYEFYADLPYFLFESTMNVSKDVELDLLRNDEMTMDSLFTHVMYAKLDGSVSSLMLYDDELDVLEENPIPDNAAWIAFYNEEKGYGFGSIRLNYDNTNLKGAISPVYKPYTKISRSSGNGRYWNRVLSDTTHMFPEGSRYHEKNAYLIFKADQAAPEKEISRYATQLRNPLKVRVVTN